MISHIQGISSPQVISCSVSLSVLVVCRFIIFPLSCFFHSFNDRENTPPDWFLKLTCLVKSIILDAMQVEACVCLYIIYNF